jgi:DNA-binding CsgD family transcriptional regulator
MSKLLEVAAPVEADKKRGGEYRLQILQMWADDHHNKSVADKLGLSVKTVEYHFAMLKRITGKFTKGGMVKWALASGLIHCMAMLCMAQPVVPNLVIPPPNTNGQCQPILWNYPTNAIGSSNAAGFTIGYGMAALTNEVSWGLSTLTASPATNGLATFSNRVCGLWLTNAYSYRARAYTATGATSEWSAVLTIAPKTNRVVTILAQSASSLSGPWTPAAGLGSITLTNPTGPAKFYRLDIQTRMQ